MLKELGDPGEIEPKRPAVAEIDEVTGNMRRASGSQGTGDFFFSARRT